MNERVLIADQLDPRAASLLQAAGLQADSRLKLPVDELKRTLREDGYAAVLVRSDTKLTREVLAEAVGLRLIVRAGVGLDNVDAAAAAEKNIKVMNTPAATTEAVAELVLGLMLALARRLSAADRSVRAGKWERKAFQGLELRGRTLGVLGFGRIGGQVAAFAHALGMSVVAYDPFVSAEQISAQGATSLGRDEVIATADLLTLHLPLTDETRNLLDGARLSSMKPGALIINAARGGVIDEAALAGLIQSGQIGGAALDVYATEPPAADNPLLALANADPNANILFTPHIGASTGEGQAAAGVNAAELVIEFFKG